jgi:hypothetical protein
MRRFILLLGASAILLAGCASFQPVTSVPRDEKQKSVIHGVRVLRELPHLLAIEVDYDYDNSVGSCAFAGATTACSGAKVCKDQPLGAWGYVPKQLKPGRHRARVLIRINPEIAKSYTSDQLKIQLYRGGKGTFVETTWPYEKHWVYSDEQPSWVRNWCKLPNSGKRKKLKCG